ncbi:MAG: type IX secretion system membrane protein PorP/SprF, partial [Flavobacteriia bacterium]
LLGLTYRNRDAFGLSAGYTFKNILNLSYTYELTVSKLNNNVSGGSHEIHLGFLLNGAKKE